MSSLDCQPSVGVASLHGGPGSTRPGRAPRPRFRSGARRGRRGVSTRSPARASCATSPLGRPDAGPAARQPATRPRSGPSATISTPATRRRTTPSSQARLVRAGSRSDSGARRWSARQQPRRGGDRDPTSRARVRAGQMPNLLAHVRAHLPADDPRRSRVEGIAAGAAAGGSPSSSAAQSRRRPQRQRGVPARDDAGPELPEHALRHGRPAASAVIARCWSSALQPGVVPLCFRPGENEIVCPTTSDR